MALQAYAPAPARCVRCWHDCRPIRVSFREEPIPTYTQVCTKPECGYAEPPPHRRISDELWNLLLARHRPNPLYLPGAEPIERQVVKAVPPPPAPTPVPAPRTPKPDVLRPGDAPTCPEGHDRLQFGSLHRQKGRRKATWRCSVCRKDREQGYKKPVPEAERTCRKGHLTATWGFQRKEHGVMMTRCRFCIRANDARWAARRKASRAEAS